MKGAGDEGTFRFIAEGKSNYIREDSPVNILYRSIVKLFARKYIEKWNYSPVDTCKKRNYILPWIYWLLMYSHLRKGMLLLVSYLEGRWKAAFFAVKADFLRSCKTTIIDEKRILFHQMTSNFGPPTISFVKNTYFFVQKLFFFF